MLVERRGFDVMQYRITANGTCPQCRRAIPGVWRAGAQRGRERAVTIHVRCG
jgi:hypothetical protein